jgi:hypothetical protein
MSTAICSFRKDPRRHLTRCKYGCECTNKSKEHLERFFHICKFNTKCYDYSLKHRKSCPHTAFGDQQEDRLRFLLNATKEIESDDKLYLWEQFSCDFNKEPIEDLHRNFLIQCYKYVIRLSDEFEKGDFTNLIDLYIIKQTVNLLEQDAITGLYYLNQAFLMWVFKQDSIYGLNDFLINTLELPALYDIHFARIKDILKTTKRYQNRTIAALNLNVEELKELYADFMLNSKARSIRLYGEQNSMRESELELINFQIKIRDTRTLSRRNIMANNSSQMIQILHISNTGLNNLIEKILEIHKIPKEKWMILSLQ